MGRDEVRCSGEEVGNTMGSWKMTARMSVQDTK
jgi:hypothetical protein